MNTTVTKSAKKTTTATVAAPSKSAATGTQGDKIATKTTAATAAASGKADAKSEAKPSASKQPAKPETTDAAAASTSKKLADKINHSVNQSADNTASKSAVPKASEVTTKTNKSTAVADEPLITEEQLLKMSDKDYMNAAQLAFFKARLQQLERDLLKNAGETTEHLRETVLVPDPADRATIEEEHALELRTRDRERKLLKKVQQSIASIDAGEYGWCEETGEPIGVPRLLARPTATLSLEAQQRRELKQKLYGD